MRTRDVLSFFSFLFLNFTALAVGGFFTKDGATSEWYLSLMKAPWTPPGWVFGAAWTTIMICFSVYMAGLWTRIENKRSLAALFALQWMLNVGWNPIFFHQHAVLPGLIVITALTLLVWFMLFRYWKTFRWSWVWIAPYAIWLVIATSLNGYILLMNG